MEKTKRDGPRATYLLITPLFMPLPATTGLIPVGPGPERFVPYFLAVAGLIPILSFLGGAYHIWARVCARRKWFIAIQIPVTVVWFLVFSILLFFSLTVLEFGGIVVLVMTAFLLLHAAIRAVRMIRWAAASRKKERPDYLAGAHPLRLTVAGLLIIAAALFLLAAPLFSLL